MRGCSIGLTGLALFFASVAGAEETVYVEQHVTSYQPVQRRVIVPVREIRPETRLHGWWNPFREPYSAVHYVPQTRWEERIETAYVPVTKRQYVAQQQTSLTGQPSPPIKFAQKPATSPKPTVPQVAGRTWKQVDAQPVVPIADLRPSALVPRR